MVVLAVSFFLYVSSIFRDIFARYVDHIANFFQSHEFFGVGIFVFVSAISVVLSPLSSLPLIPSAIDVWGKLLTFVFLMVGWFVGSWIGYLIGGYAGAKIIRRFFNLDKAEYYKKKLSEKSQFWLVVLFRLAIPSEITGFTLGVLRYHLGKYLFAVFLTEIPFAFISVYLGNYFLEGSFLVFSTLFALTVSLIILASYYFHRKLK